MDLKGAVWRKSSRSSDTGGQCVEVAGSLPGIVAIRDSKDPNGPALLFSTYEWRMFVADIKAGRFDSLA